MTPKSYGFTHKGLVRGNNEDAILVEDKLRVFAVADGVGGSRYGEIASSLAVETLKSYVQTHIESGKSETNSKSQGLSHNGELLVSAVKEAHYAITSKANNDKKFDGMMTTIAAVFLDNTHIHITHIGDSRVYLVRDDQLFQLTKDHTLLNYQLDNNLINQENSLQFPPKNAITHALGMNDEIFIEYRKKKVIQDDIYLIATDGLTNFITENEIKGILLEAQSLEGRTHKLFEKAMEQGGKDNISIVLIQIQ